MATCANCRTTIIVGGTSVGGHRFCSAECAAKGPSGGTARQDSAPSAPPGSAWRRSVVLLGLVAGAALAAVSLTVGVWELAFWNSRNSAGGFPFIVVWMAVLSGIVLLRAGYRRVEVVPGLVRALRDTFSIAAVTLPIAGASAAMTDTKAAYAVYNMRADLRELVRLQDSVRAASGNFASSFDPTLLHLRSRSEDLALDMTPGGWSATVRHGQTPQTCAVFLGGPPRPPAYLEREPACTRPPLDIPRLLLTVTLFAVGLAGATLAAERAGAPRGTWPG